MALYLGSNKVGSGSGNLGNAVLYTEQNLTEEQKAQARENIGVDSLDAGVQNITTGTGLVATKTDDTVAIDIDDDVTWGFDCGTAEDLIEPLSVEELQEKYIFVYYSTMEKAVTDVNNGTTANGDATKDSAVAGVYIDENGGCNVVLLKDHTESNRIQTSVDMTINLGGHKLSSENKIVIVALSGNLVIDGRLAGSRLSNRQSGNNRASLVATTETTNVFINGGQYTCYGENLPANHGAIVATGSLVVKDAEIIIEGTAGYSYGIMLGATGTAVISNSDIIATNIDGHSFGVAINSGRLVTIVDCNIKAYSNYTYGDDDYYGADSRGVYNGGILTLNNCNVIGTHCGVSNHGTITVNGGTYDGYGHGGIYFAADNTTSYVEDAIIRDCTMPEGYVATANKNGAGFYIGSAANQNVYMDNCDIYGSNSGQTIAIAGSYGAHDNTLYISNSTINHHNGGAVRVRIDDANNKLYIGVGNNFTAEDTSLPEAVIVTDEMYVAESSPAIGKKIKSRIAFKHDTEANWNLAAGFIPMAGEVIIYDKDTHTPYQRMKIGDGVTNVNDLQFSFETYCASDAVLYTHQTLTEKQKAQARTNIGAASVEDVLAALPMGEGVRY